MLRTGRALDLVVGSGEAVALAWPGAGSHMRSMHRIRLGEGSSTAAQRHPGEAVYVVVDGRGAVRSPGTAVEPIATHQVVFVRGGCEYVFETEAGMTVVGGPCPPDPALYGDVPEGAPPAPDGPPLVLDRGDGVPLPLIAKDARLVVWPGMGARVATLALVRLEAGEENAPHAHPVSDDTIVVLEGFGSVENVSTGSSRAFEAGDVIFIPAGTVHRVKADRGVAVVSAGGPCPSDEGLLRAGESSA